jgi:hypothetical protein
MQARHDTSLPRHGQYPEYDKTPLHSAELSLDMVNVPPGHGKYIFGHINVSLEWYMCGTSSQGHGICPT